MYFAVFCNRFSIWSEQKRRVGRTPRMAPYRHAAAVQIDIVPFGKAGKPAADVARHCTCVARHVCSRVFCGLREKNQLRSLFRRLPHILLGHTHIFIHIRPGIHLHQACNYFFHLFVPSFHMLSCDFSAYTLVYYIAYSPKQLPKFAIFIPFAAFIF